MEKAIYKITNKINNKIYIGQSSNPHRRWLEHINNYYKKEKSLISQAIQKYGVENFSFEILGWFEDYNEKEKYYIKLFRTIAPYGYNIQFGGNEPPHFHGEEHPNASITQELAKKIQLQAMDWSIPRKKIVKDNKITFNIFRHINEGNSWHDDNLNYPLRPDEKILNEIRAKKVIELLQTTKLSQSEIAKRVGWNRSAITMINIGKNHRQENLSYPIRK